MASRSDRKRARASTSSYVFESRRSKKARLFKHTAVNEMIDLIENKGPWKVETREKVMDIAQQVIDDLQPFESSYDPFQKDLYEIITDLRSVIGIINTPIFQVVASYEALSLLKLIKENLKDIDVDISRISDDDDKSDEERPKLDNVSRPLSEFDYMTLDNGSAHLRMLRQMSDRDQSDREQSIGSVQDSGDDGGRTRRRKRR